MRQAYAHDAVLMMPPDADTRAPGGAVTTALALSWTWYLLCEHAEVEEKLVAEFRDKLGDRPLTLWFKDSGDVHVRLGNQLKTLVNDLKVQGDTATGDMVLPGGARQPLTFQKSGGSWRIGRV